MPTKQLMCVCSNCQRPTMHIQQTRNNILHFLLTVCTAGLWILVWMLVGSSAPQCTNCGVVVPNYTDKVQVIAGTILLLLVLMIVIFAISR